MSREMNVAVSERLTGAPVAAAPPISVVTRVLLAASPAEIWNALTFYEEISRPPPLHLRLLLPVPRRVVGRVHKVGDELTCLYEGGDLLKRITRIERGDSYEFEVVEQALSFGGDIRLSGGRFVLRELPDGHTELSVETRYRSSRSPRWFWKRLERLVCHSFHRHLLGSMRSKIESR